MLGSNLEGGVSGYWTRPLAIDSVDVNKIHGHIFPLSSGNEFIAYEYRDGPVVDGLGDIVPSFFRELVQYLRDNKLENLLGLQVLGSPNGEWMMEFVIHDKGTIMLKQSGAQGILYRLTGWTFTSAGPGGIQWGEEHAKMVNDNHKVFFKGESITMGDVQESIMPRER